MKELFIDVAVQSLNKRDEELCGDKIEVFKSKDRTIIVLADGLGSGVKANILATLTTKIACTMLKQGASIGETIETIMNTLPVCQVRKIAYSTFAIVEINAENICSIIEYDNPPIVLIRKNKLLELEKIEQKFNDKVVKCSRVKLEENDFITIMSDGVVHAGVGESLNHGWEWHHVADFLKRQHFVTAEAINRRLIDTCNKLYAERPGDDTSSVTVKLRKPEVLNLFTGPPADPADDAYLVQKFIKCNGLKVICGGTAANIVARELNLEIETDINFIDPEIPPTAKMKGIDLVTEGVLTLRKTCELLNEYHLSNKEDLELKEDGASMLKEILLFKSTHIKLWVGNAINPAHQNPDFPIELSIKLNIVDQLIKCLRLLGKQVDITYF